MNNYTRITFGCYISNVCMAIVANLSPLLFVTFQSVYGINYTLLGLLIFINFSTQLLVDVIFSFFSQKFNIEKTVKTMPLLTIIGLATYAVVPLLFPNLAYFGLLVGTIIASASSGLAEVLVSPVVAAIPSDNKERALSILHAMYAWGVVGTVLFSTAFIFVFGAEKWYMLALLFLLLPIISFLLFLGTKFPEMASHEKSESVFALFKNKYLVLCIVAIFLGGASEVVIAQWSSGFFEQALQLPKIYGDVFGVATFALTMGIGRSLYGKIGSNIHKTMTLGAVLTTLCYIVIVVSDITIISLVACTLAGFGVAMLWPGSLVLATDEFPQGGVAIFALMAVGGDMGAAVVPQFVGIIADFASSNAEMLKLASYFNFTTEQFALKSALLVATLIPLISIFVYLKAWRISRKNAYNI